MEQQTQSNKKFQLLKYVVAWLAYSGAFLTQCSNIGNVVRDSFTGIHVPKKEEFYE